MGLLKKAMELSIMTNCQMCLVIFDEGGNLDAAYSCEDVESMFEKYTSQSKLSLDFQLLNNEHYEELKVKPIAKKKKGKREVEVERMRKEEEEGGRKKRGRRKKGEDSPWKETTIPLQITPTLTPIPTTLS